MLGGRKTVICEFLRTGMISVMPVPLLSVHPRGYTKGQNKLCKQCTRVHTSCVLQISAKLTFAKACWEASQTL